MTGTNIEKLTSMDVPLPTCEVNSKGKITKANEHIGEVFIYRDITDSDFFAITGVRLNQLSEAADGKRVLVDRNGKNFRVFLKERKIVNNFSQRVYDTAVTSVGTSCHNGAVFHGSERSY